MGNAIKKFGQSSENRIRRCPLVENSPSSSDLEVAIFAAGWFWGPEHQYGRVLGVRKTLVGYTGGKKLWPTYRHIGDHTEAVRLEFDPKIIPYDQLLDKIFASASPFRGPSAFSKQYQSGVWWTSEAQKAALLAKVNKIEASTGKKVKMEMSAAKNFYRAEEYHQKYIAKGR